MYELIQRTDHNNEVFGMDKFAYVFYIKGVIHQYGLLTPSFQYCKLIKILDNSQYSARISMR